ncbi:MAG: ABC transporter ATP-binding protein [Acidobacteriota bacterium]|nr:ABC transporter ATP-binding protein [Acidobacteriota bacterium]
MPPEPAGAGRAWALATLIPYLRQYRARIATGVVMVLMTNVAVVVTPQVLGWAVDDLTEGADAGLLLRYAGLLLALSCAEGLFRYLMRWILIGVSRRIEFDLRNDLFRHLQRLTPSFYQRHSTGDVMARSTNDLGAVRMVLGPGIMYSVNTLFMVVLTVTILIRTDAGLALLTLAPLLLVSYCVKFFGRKIHRRFEKIQEQFSMLTTLVQENVSGIRVVKAYNQESAFVNRFRDANREYMKRSMALVKIWGVFYPLLAFLLGLSAVFLLWYGGRQVMDGALSLGALVSFIFYLARLTWPTIALGWVINTFERGSASMGRINRILATQPDVLDDGGIPAEAVEGRVEVKNLTFSYNGTPVLKNLEFELPAGDTLAIVGSTGSGKSTLVHLLCRLYPVPRGRILIDGRDVNDISLTHLRRSIGCVPQDTFLFSESIRDNLTFGAPDASDQAIREAARTSNILGEIQRFPDRMATFVGERGLTLSGGQKQRMTIARALLTDPRILVLDDSLSSVDTYTEEEILKRLAPVIAGRTTILISHRISTVKGADQILVLDRGRIVQRGRHRELLRTAGPYAEMHRKQLLEQELGIA